MIYRPLFFSAE